MTKEDIINIPNTLTAYRVLLTLFIIFAAVFKLGLLVILVAFVLGMLTDFFDGQIARRYNQVTEFGRKFDMIADRILMIVTVIAILVIFRYKLTTLHTTEIFMIMLREIIGFPFAAYTMLKKGLVIPHARDIGKAVTFMQGLSFPLILLSTVSNNFGFVFYLAVATGVLGIFSGIMHIKDLKIIS